MVYHLYGLFWGLFVFLFCFLCTYKGFKIYCFRRQGDDSLFKISEMKCTKINLKLVKGITASFIYIICKGDFVLEL